MRPLCLLCLPRSVVLDAEAVAFDHTTGKILPFQVGGGAVHGRGLCKPEVGGRIMAGARPGGTEDMPARGMPAALAPVRTTHSDA